MKKRMIALAVASAMFGAGSAFAAAPAISVNGYASVELNVTDELNEENEGQFSVPETEVNFDSDNLFIAIDGSDTDDYFLAQAFFKYQITDGWKLRGGKFDSNFTADEGAAPDRQFTQNSLLFDAVNAVGGASLTGLEVAGVVGPVTARLAYANDTSVIPTPGPGGVDGENSVMLLLNAAPMEGLDLELGILTQDKDGNGAGTLTDLNGTYMINNFTVGLDFLASSDADPGEFDNGYSVWAGYNFGNGFNIKARYDNASPEGNGDDVKATELYASYSLTDNLLVALDLHNTDPGNGADDYDTNTIQFVATF
jgi:hypothetical protein